MKLYINKLPKRVTEHEEYKEYKPIYEFKNSFLQFISYLLTSLAILTLIILCQKYVFKMMIRKGFSQADLIPKILILSIITLAVSRYVIRALTFIILGLFKSYRTGFHLKSLSVFNFVEQPLGKIKRIISLLTPLLIITPACLYVMKTLNSTWVYLFMYMLYINGAISCGDVLNVIFVALTKKGSKTLDMGRGLYAECPLGKIKENETEKASSDAEDKIKEEKSDEPINNIEENNDIK